MFQYWLLLIFQNFLQKIFYQDRIYSWPQEYTLEKAMRVGLWKVCVIHKIQRSFQLILWQINPGLSYRSCFISWILFRRDYPSKLVDQGQHWRTDFILCVKWSVYLLWDQFLLPLGRKFVYLELLDSYP